jgi:hypothetical protein
VGSARRAPDAATARRFAALSTWCVLALAFESKMPLNSRLHHYGFFLAAPASMLLVAVVAWWIPQELFRRFRRGGLVRAAALAAVLAGALAHLEQSQGFYAAKNAAFGRGGDTLLTYSGRRDGKSQGMQRVLERIEALVHPDEDFVALPYGIMLNYQTRRRSPSPHMRWTGLELIVYGEPRMLATLQRDPPDWVVLVHCASQDEFQLGRFGEDPRSGRALVAWIREHYELVERIGAPPFAGPRFGAELRRRTRPGPPGPGAASP